MSTPIPSDGPFQISKLVRSALVIFMRSVFATDPNYPYVLLADGRTDMDNTIIEITDVDPIECAKFPAIIVSSHSDRGGSIYFSDDFISNLYDDNGTLIGERHGNQLRLNVNLEAWAFSSIEREEIVDSMYIYLKTHKDIFANLGIEIRMVELIPPRQESIGTRVQFVAGLSVDTYSEWTVTDDISPSELITKFTRQIQTGITQI